MGGSPWQQALASIREALVIQDVVALEAARAAALELAVPKDLKGVLQEADAEQLLERLPDWVTDEFAERALARSVKHSADAQCEGAR